MGVRDGWGMRGQHSWGVWDGPVHTAIFKMDSQQGPTVQHRDLCSLSCGCSILAWRIPVDRGAWPGREESGRTGRLSTAQPGWEGTLGENGHMYMCTCAASLFSWNYHDIVHWLYSSTKLKVLFLTVVLRLQSLTRRSSFNKSGIRSSLYVRWLSSLVTDITIHCHISLGDGPTLVLNS